MSKNLQKAQNFVNQKKLQAKQQMINFRIWLKHKTTNKNGNLIFHDILDSQKFDKNTKLENTKKNSGENDQKNINSNDKNSDNSVNKNSNLAENSVVLKKDLTDLETNSQKSLTESLVESLAKKVENNSEKGLENLKNQIQMAVLQNQIQIYNPELNNPISFYSQNSQNPANSQINSNQIIQNSQIQTEQIQNPNQEKIENGQNVGNQIDLKNKDSQSKENDKETPIIKLISDENKKMINEAFEEIKKVTEEKTLEIKEDLTKITNEKLVVANEKFHNFMIQSNQNFKNWSEKALVLRQKFESSQFQKFDYSKFVTEKNFIMVSETIIKWIFPISVWVRTLGILITLGITLLSWTEGKYQINFVGLLLLFLVSSSLVFILSREFIEKAKNRFESKDFKIRFFVIFGILFLLSLQFWPVVGGILFTFAFQSSFLVFESVILAAVLVLFGHHYLLNVVPKKEILGNLLLFGGFLSWYAVFRFSFNESFPDFINIVYIFVIANTFSNINAIDLFKLNLQTIATSILVYTATTRFPSGVEMMVLGFICALGVMIRVALDFWHILIKTFRRNEELLHNTLPPSIAKRLQTETLIADSFESASVLFCDIVGYTTYSSGKNPEDVVKTLNFIFSQFDELCDQLGLEKIKTIGDAYMVAGGLLGNHQDHAYKIAKMGLGIRGIIRNLDKEYGLNMRIGIHSGKVVAGVIGLKKLTYDIWGDTVNVASRMESHSLPGQIQISDTTYQLIKNDFEFSESNLIEVKGKGQMKTYFLVSDKVKTKETISQNKPNLIENINKITNFSTDNSTNNSKNLANNSTNTNNSQANSDNSNNLANDLADNSIDKSWQNPKKYPLTPLTVGTLVNSVPQSKNTNSENKNVEIGDLEIGNGKSDDLEKEKNLIISKKVSTNKTNRQKNSQKKLEKLLEKPGNLREMQNLEKTEEIIDDDVNWNEVMDYQSNSTTDLANDLVQNSNSQEKFPKESQNSKGGKVKISNQKKSPKITQKLELIPN